MARAKTNYRPQLVRAKKSNVLIRIARTVEDGSELGYVVGIGQTFFLMARVSDDVFFSGFSASRISDLATVVAPPPNAYLLRDITRIDFGGLYEQALHQVGGDPSN